MRWWKFVWAKPTSVIATIVLTVVLAFGSLTGRSNWPWSWIVALSAFIVLHSIVGWVLERNRLGRNYEGILRRTLHLVADLAELTGGRFDLWMVDLYLPRNLWKLSAQWPFVGERKLVRALSVALTDVSKAPVTIDLNHNLFGPCFTRSESRLWWDINLAELDGARQNHWYHLADPINRELRTIFGAISIQPVVDSVGKDCRGLLIVHTVNDPEIATTALSGINQSRGRRHLAGAREGIHVHLAKQ